MPSQAALERGTAVARDILESHQNTSGGAWPETVAVRVLPHTLQPWPPSCVLYLRQSPPSAYAIFLGQGRVKAL